MRCVDVNVLVNAHRPEAPAHEEHLAWLDAARVAPEPLGLSDVVLSGFLRVVTHPKVFRDPTPLDVAIEFAGNLKASPACVRLTPGERYWEIFVDLCRDADARGNVVPDAFLAALAIEHNATLATADRGFHRFPALRIEHPADAGKT